MKKLYAALLAVMTGWLGFAGSALGSSYSCYALESGIAEGERKIYSELNMTVILGEDIVSLKYRKAGYDFQFDYTIIAETGGWVKAVRKFDQPSFSSFYFDKEAKTFASSFLNASESNLTHGSCF